MDSTKRVLVTLTFPPEYIHGFESYIEYAVSHNIEICSSSWSGGR